MKDYSTGPSDRSGNTKKVSRRKLLTGIGMTGLSVVSGAAFAEDLIGQAGIEKTRFYRYGNTMEMCRDSSLKAGDIAQTAGYYEPGDGGAAEYLISETTEDPDYGVLAGLKNNLVARLLPENKVNYKQFGTKSDGTHDDGIQIKAAHAYANRVKIPVVNTSGEFWIKNTNDIEIRTNVQWGQSIFHIDEKFNDKRNSKFNVRNDEEPVSINFTASQKKEFLSKFKPGVAIIEELAPYKNSLLVITDENDRIGFRSGKAYKGKVSRKKEELFYVEEHGRIIGDIAWEFNDYTDFIAYPASDSYLVIDGGTFYVSGGGSGISTNGYEKNGFQVFRSRTIIRNQWVGLEKGKSDTAIIQRSGFYTFSTVYDVTLENVRLLPWEKERTGGKVRVPQGTYGIGGNLMMNATFRNVTAEGGPVHWGVFGTNMNKNFRVEGCRLNRIDVHFHCWNLYIKDCEIGFKGVTITGGGDLFVENTTSHSMGFINFRRDYGAKWDGDIRIERCRLCPPKAGTVYLLSFLAENFNYRYPIGYGRSIAVNDFVIDYRSAPESNSDAWLMRTSPFSKTDTGERVFFPSRMVFRNVRVQGRLQGLRLMEISDPRFFKLQTEGGYDGITITPNCKLVFDDVQLANLSSVDDQEKQHISFSSSGTGPYSDAFALYPELHFSGCKGFSGHFGENCMKLVFTNCLLNNMHTTSSALLQGSIDFWDCGFKPVFIKEDEIAYVLSAELGISFTNCIVYLPQMNGQPKPALFDQVGFIKMNKMVCYNHLNTRLGRDVIQYYKSMGIEPSNKFIAMLKNHHEMESENV